MPVIMKWVKAIKNKLNFKFLSLFSYCHNYFSKWKALDSKRQVVFDNGVRLCLAIMHQTHFWRKGSIHYQQLLREIFHRAAYMNPLSSLRYRDTNVNIISHRKY